MVVSKEGLGKVIALTFSSVANANTRRSGVQLIGGKVGLKAVSKQELRQEILAYMRVSYDVYDVYDDGWRKVGGLWLGGKTHGGPEDDDFVVERYLRRLKMTMEMSVPVFLFVWVYVMVCGLRCKEGRSVDVW